MITKVIEIDVDELKALGGLDNLNKAVAQTDKTTASLKTQIREATIELVNAQKEFGDYSDAALNAAKKVATLKDQIQEAKETSALFDPGAKFQAATGAIAAGANAIQGYQASLGLLGVEGEAAQETLLKVQSAIALSQSLSGVADSVKDFKRLAAVAQQYTIVQKAITAGQWLWNAAQAANPIGAIIAAVVALIAAGVALTKYFMDNSEAAKNNAAAVEKNRLALESQTKTLERNSEQFDKKQKQELAIAKASGMSAEAIRKLELKLIDEKIAYEKSQRAIAENTYQKNLNTLASLKAAGADEEVIKKQQETANESIKQFNKQNQDVRKALDEKKDIQDRHLVEVKTAEVSSAKENAQRRKEQQDKAKEELKKQFDEAKKIADDARIQNANAGKTELELLEEKFKKEKALLEKNKIDTNELEIKYLNERNEILLKQQEEEQKVKDKQKEDKLKEEEEEREKQELLRVTTLENQKKLNEELIIAETNLQSAKRAALETSLDVLQQFAGKNKAIALTILAVQKGLAIADVITSASASIASQVAANQKANQGVLAFYAPYGPAGLAAATTQIGANTALLAKGIATTKIGAAVNIASILATTLASAKSTVGGGTSGGGGGVPSGGGGGGATAAPSFNVVGNAGVNQIANTLGVQQPIQAYVVANNVTTAQSLDRNIVQNASLG